MFIRNFIVVSFISSFKRMHRPLVRICTKSQFPLSNFQRSTSENVARSILIWFFLTNKSCSVWTKKLLKYEQLKGKRITESHRLTIFYAVVSKPKTQRQIFNLPFLQAHYVERILNKIVSIGPSQDERAFWRSSEYIVFKIHQLSQFGVSA